MSIDQRQFVGEITKWVMRISVAISGALIAQIYFEVKSDVHDIKVSVDDLQDRMIRIEYELKLK